MKSGYYTDAIQAFSKVNPAYNNNEKEQYIDLLIAADVIPMPDKIPILLKLMLDDVNGKFIHHTKEKLLASTLSKDSKAMVFDSINSIEKYLIPAEKKFEHEEKPIFRPSIPLDFKSAYHEGLLANAKFSIIHYVLSSEAGLHSTDHAPSHLGFFGRLFDHLTGINAGICYLTLLNTIDEKSSNAAISKEIILYALLMQAGPTLSQRICHALGVINNDESIEILSTKDYLYAAILEKFPGFAENKEGIIQAINHWVKASNSLLTAERKSLQKESGNDEVYWHYFKSHMQHSNFPNMDQIVVQAMQKSPKPT